MDASYETHLAPADLNNLVAALLVDLSDQPASPVPQHDVRVIDALTTVMSVRQADDRMHEAGSRASCGA